MNRRHPFLKLTALALLLIAAAVALRVTPLGELLARERMVEMLETLRGSLWAPLLFVAAYAGLTAIALPGSLLTIVGGAAFGFGWGFPLVLAGANLGANAAFVVSRWLGRDGIERIAGQRLAGLDRATQQHGFVGLLVLRLIPLVPFNALNFGSGLTAMRWRDYALATAVGILPGAAVYVYSADALVRGYTEPGGAAQRLWIAGVLFLALSLIPIAAKRLGYGLPQREAVRESDGA
jgi:uncharacterized membrane protein YdjX (TVP38/TMEM64 family)